MPQRVSATAKLRSRLSPVVAELRLHFRLVLDTIALLLVPGTRSLLTLVALVVASGLVPVASVVVTARMVDRLLPAVTSGGAEGTVLPLVLWALASAALVALAQVVTTAVRLASSRHEEQLKKRVTTRIHEQSARLDLAFYESPELFDHLHRAREEASHRPAELCQAFVSLLQGSVTLAGLGAVIFTFEPWLVMVLLIGGAPVLYVAVIKALEDRRWRREAARAERRASYYDHALKSADFASEQRIFGWAPRFQEEYATLQARLDGEQLALGRRHGKADLIAAGASLVVLSAGGAWIVRQAILGVVSLGQLAGFGQAFATGLSTIRSWLGGLRLFYANTLFIEDLCEFLTMEPRIVSPKAPASAPARLRHGIQFRNVTFHYPGTDVAALDRFTLHIPAGQRAAIVGPNGAGKSTIIKLLCRLYDPVEGAIEIDGVDIRQFDLADLRNLVSPLFQEPVRYYQSAWDNVTIGGVGPDVTPQQVQKASVAAGASAVIMGLPRGYNTVLGKWFDEGTQLSSGEWQRIALARAIARPSPIVVLDEPTSALDPWMEAHWYPRFCEVAAGRTAVIVTHRFTTAMMADITHVVDHGRVIESGSHASLMALGGRYAYAWTATHSVPQQPAKQVAS